MSPNVKEDFCVKGMFSQTIEETFCRRLEELKFTKVESGCSRFGLLMLLFGQSLAPQNLRISSVGAISDPLTTVGSRMVDEITDPTTISVEHFIKRKKMSQKERKFWTKTSFEL